MIRSGSNYLAIGIVNTLFAYFAGVSTYKFFGAFLGAFYCSILTSIVSIAFTISSYHFFFFRGRGIINRFVKGFISYGIISIICAFVFSFLVQFVDIWIAQGVLILIAFSISTISNFLFVFSDNR